jgi:hypothetical protein
VDSAASPQDLSTSSTGAGQSSESGSRGSPTAPQSGQRSSSTAGSAQAENNNSNSKNSGQGQPQIYPWMRKVHVGQSKFAKSKSDIRPSVGCMCRMHHPHCCSCCSLIPLSLSCTISQISIFSLTEDACQAETRVKTHRSVAREELLVMLMVTVQDEV